LIITHPRQIGIHKGGIVGRGKERIKKALLDQKLSKSTDRVANTSEMNLKIPSALATGRICCEKAFNIFGSNQCDGLIDLIIQIRVQVENDAKMQASGAARETLTQQPVAERIHKMTQRATSQTL
jgi:hypothetical protein